MPCQWGYPIKSWKVGILFYIIKWKRSWSWPCSCFVMYGKSCSSYAIQYWCFIVLLSFLTLIQVKYIHKIKKKMRQGSPRKPIKLVERTTFKNILINKVLTSARQSSIDKYFSSIIFIRKGRRFVSKQGQPQPRVHFTQRLGYYYSTTVQWSIFLVWG